MRKIALGLVVLVSLLCVEALELTQEEIEYHDKRYKDGDSLFCAGLGQSYLLGIEGLDKDYKKAKFYLEKVCKKGNEKDEYFLEACTTLGLLYSRGGYGVPQDYKKALKLYNLACDKGDAGACQNLGAMYYNGYGVPQDWVKGAGYVKRACDAGSWMACSNFAQHHYNHGDKGKATSYFKKACELGKDDPSAQIVPEFEEAWQYACDRYEN